MFKYFRGKMIEEGREERRMADDLISRQAAIDAMADAIWHYPNEKYAELNDYENARHLADYGLSRLPSAQHWIPCSERLPKKDERYQVTRHDYVTNTEFIDILWYEKKIWWNGHSTGDYAVTAWMPLPKPYEVEE